MPGIVGTDDAKEPPKTSEAVKTEAVRTGFIFVIPVNCLYSKANRG